VKFRKRNDSRIWSGALRNGRREKGGGSERIKGGRARAVCYYLLLGVSRIVIALAIARVYAYTRIRTCSHDDAKKKEDRRGEGQMANV